MKLLLINNHSKHIKELLKQFKEVKLVDFQNLDNIDVKKYDAIILSGGSSYSVIGHKKIYSKELKLIKTFKKPILGICLGFELIAFAFNEELKMMTYNETGILPIKLIGKNKLFDKFPKEFDVYEAHRWIVKKTKYLKQLAKSKDGIEAIKHPEKEIYGVQFHPEVLIKKSHAKRIFKNFLEIVKK